MPQPHQQILLVMSSDFYAGFHQASLDFELLYKPCVTTFDDTHLASIFARSAMSNKRSDLWKAGYQAGFLPPSMALPTSGHKKHIPITCITASVAPGEHHERTDRPSDADPQPVPASQPVSLSPRLVIMQG